jgi:hypothetical protein
MVARRWTNVCQRPRTPADARGVGASVRGYLAALFRFGAPESCGGASVGKLLGWLLVRTTLRVSGALALRARDGLPAR